MAIRHRDSISHTALCDCTDLEAEAHRREDHALEYGKQKKVLNQLISKWPGHPRADDCTRTSHSLYYKLPPQLEEYLELRDRLKVASAMPRRSGAH